MAPYITSAFAASAPQLLWADLLVVCSGILLAGVLFLLAAGWERRLSWWVRLRPLPLLGASVATLLAAHHLCDTYADILITGYTKSGLYGCYYPAIPIGSSASAPQLMWADILVICASILLALSLVSLAVSWERHLSWWIRLSALLPLAASVAAEVAAQHLYDTFAGWVGFLACSLGARMPPVVLERILNALGHANQEATVLGWIGVTVTGILLAVALRVVAGSVWTSREAGLGFYRSRILAGDDIPATARALPATRHDPPIRDTV